MSESRPMPDDFMPDVIKVTVQHRAADGETIESSARLIDPDGYSDSAEFRRRFEQLRHSIWMLAERRRLGLVA